MDALTSRREFCRCAGLSLTALASMPAAFCESQIRAAGTASADEFNVRTFGASGDGRSLDTVAIQSAIEAAHRAGGGTVLLPSGIYLSGTLTLKSKVELRLSPDSVLLGSTSRSDYQRGYWYALLLAEDQQDIALSGGGTINGQGRELAQDVIRRVKQGEILDNMGNNRPHEKERPQLIEFRNCRGVHISGVTLRDSSCWVQNYIECEDLTIDRIRVTSTVYWNNDGIDITDCKRVKVTHCDINSADDGICLKSTSAAGCEDVEVADCRIRSSASAFKCGTASYGGFRNIRVQDLAIHDTYRSAVALECVDGGIVENVRVENVHATNTGNGVFLRLGKRNQKAPIGKLEDIVIRDIKVEVPAGRPDQGYATPGPEVEQPHNIYPSSIDGLPDHPVRNVTLENVELAYAGGALPERASVSPEELSRIPEQASDYPEFSMFGELPAWGIYVRHAEEIELRNFHVSLKQADFRPAMVFDDVRRLRLEDTEVGLGGGTPVLLLNDTPDAVLNRVKYPKGCRETVRLMGKSSLGKKKVDNVSRAAWR